LNIRKRDRDIIERKISSTEKVFSFFSYKKKEKKKKIEIRFNEF